MTVRFDSLFVGLFDDAALYPPASLDVSAAVRGHARHKLSWYADMVGPLVCNAQRLAQVADQVRSVGLPSLDIALVIPAGLSGLTTAVDQVEEYPELVLRAVELPYDGPTRDDVLRFLRPLRQRASVYLEMPVVSVSERHVHDLKAEGLRLKLRTGGTLIDSFRTERELARPILLCASERLEFKCTAGLHHAVRHRDRETLFEHHGFLNIALAARIAAATGNLEATANVLAERNPQAIAYYVNDLDEADLTAIRALFCSFGTCSIDEPIADLTALGLVAAQ